MRVPRGVPLIDGGRPLPDVTEASPELLAVGGTMTVERLLEAYGKGIFPWSVNPVTWWSPDPRAVFDLKTVHIPRRLRTLLKSHPYRVSFDEAFEQVMRACADVPRAQEETWITPGFLAAYAELHRAGHAHSIELWRGDELVAGVYGVAIGGLFAGESMFHRETNASKLALILLQQRLIESGYVLFDTQMVTEVTEMLGAHEIPRKKYMERLQEALHVSAKWPSSKGGLEV
jgi:leucyl/phenylalanyl-tRNA--protein transferase